MPTDKRLNLTFNEKDIADINQIREDMLNKNRSGKYNYVDVLREIIKFVKANPDRFNKSI